MKYANIDTKRPMNTKQRGFLTGNYNKSTRRKCTWCFKCLFSRQLIKTLGGKAVNATVVAERNSKTDELRYIGQETIKKFNNQQGAYEEHRTGRKFDVIKLSSGVWVETEQVIQTLENQLGGNKEDGILVDKTEVFF